MLIGVTPSPSRKPADPAAGTADIYDVATPDFESRVIQESLKRPVLIDFWAPWCGPCKQLGPALEAAVTAAKGKVALAKVDIDQNPQIAQAFRVQSIPTVIALYQGQPVTAFAGARPKAELDKLVDQLAKLQAQHSPEALDIPLALKDAALRLSENDLTGAQQIYAAILQQEPAHVDAYVGMVRVFIAAGEIEQADGMVAGAPDEIQKAPGFAAAKTALDLARSAPGDDLAVLSSRLQAQPQDPALLFTYAEACCARGLKDEAVGSLVEILRRQRGWEDDKARKQLLKYFEAWGPADPATIAGRKKLSAVLFS